MQGYACDFKRKEIKYVVDGRMRAGIEPVIAAHLPKSRFADTRVNSLYLDTPGHEIIIRSLEKPLYKEKLRIRWYGEGSLQDVIERREPAFIELKKKYKGIVYKRRVELEAYLAGCGNAVPMQQQIAREIDAFTQRHPHLFPAAFIECMRRAYEEYPGGLRITFDDCLEGKRPGERCGIELLMPKCSVMEIKSGSSLPLWLTTALSDLRIYPQSFSKYGEFFKKEMMGNVG